MAYALSTSNPITRTPCGSNRLLGDEFPTQDIWAAGYAEAAKLNPNSVGRLALHLPPSDRAVMGILTLAVLVAGVSWRPLGHAPSGYFTLHAALLAGFTAIAVYLGRRERASAVQFLRPLVTVAVMFTLYTSLGKLGVAAMPYDADAMLSQADTWLFGVDPSLWIQRYQTPGCIEFLSFCYAAFIPYINLSLALNSLGRAAGDRDAFLTGWVFTYALSFLGYLFVLSLDRSNLVSYLKTERDDMV